MAESRARVAGSTDVVPGLTHGAVLGLTGCGVPAGSLDKTEDTERAAVTAACCLVPARLGHELFLLHNAPRQAALPGGQLTMG